jgi:hypothetical protein
MKTMATPTKPGMTPRTPRQRRMSRVRAPIAIFLASLAIAGALTSCMGKLIEAQEASITRHMEPTR